ncbi:DUF222 domain-containing protein [Amycolatopsis sp. cg5]|uniref:DUF222 domain-containing protein n=1 Tax=Amycolatopsis sp. cg5 TaxID=3238802 RepID=UPI003526B721
MSSKQAVSAQQLSDDELTAAMLASEEALSREYARIVDLVGEFDKRSLAPAKGYRNTSVFLVNALRLSYKEARARVAHAKLAMPIAKTALASGKINREHLQEIERVLSRAPESLPDTELAAGEDALVTLARQASPFTVRKSGAGFRSYWDVEIKDPKTREKELARPRRTFSYNVTSDGLMEFSGVFDPETSTLVAGVLAPLSKPDPADEIGKPDRRTKDERQGDAVAAVFDLAARAPDMPISASERTTMTVTVGLDELERRAGVAMLADHQAVSVSQLLKMCCDARVVPAVLGTAGQVLHLGQPAELASPAQLAALAIRDRGCSRPGCTRGPKWCAPQQMTRWIAEHGPVELNDLALVCERDRHLLHHTDWEIQASENRIEWVPPAWLDPERTPISNTAHDPPHHSAA